MKIRHLIAIAGIAIATGIVVFMQSLVATNDAQAQVRAEQMSAPWQGWRIEGLRLRGRGRNPSAAVPAAPSDATAPEADWDCPLFALEVDWRPDGRVLQGPPQTAILAPAGVASPYANAPLADGAWVDDNSGTPEIVCLRGVFNRFGKCQPPPVGSTVTFIGQQGAAALRVRGYLDMEKAPPGFPTVFGNRAAMAAFADEKPGRGRFWHRAPAEFACDTPQSIAPRLVSDAGRDLDRAKLLLLWGAALTALALLVNALLLSVEARRHELSLLRLVGVTRNGIVARVLAESALLATAGALFGIALGAAASRVYVAFESDLFPMGWTFAARPALVCAAAAMVVALVAVLFALRPALAIRPLDAIAARPRRKRPWGMIVAFAFGYGAFAAVETWGASLMRAFVPSPEWPDAIVSMLPAGVSSFDIEKLRRLPHIAAISELQPLQVPLAGDRRDNVLLLASDRLPRFRFAAGDWQTASNTLFAGDNCVITEMMAYAQKLQLGDELRVTDYTGTETALKIVGIVDLNWHMVTSRGLVRGLNGASPMTAGPVFTSFDTLAACDPRPQEMVGMTHLWLDYEPEFLSRLGAFEAGRIVEREIVDALGGAYSESAEGEVRGNAVRLHSRDEIADGTLAHGAELIGAMARIPFIFIAVLSLGFIATIVADADRRAGELRILHTLGATRLRIAGLLAAGALKTAAWGLAAGLFAGSAIGFACTIPTRAIWSLPASFSLPAAPLATGAALAICCTLAVAVPTAVLRIGRR